MTTLKIPRISDAVAFKLFKKLGERFHCQALGIDLGAFIETLNVKLASEPDGRLTYIIDKDAHSIRSISCSVLGLTIQYQRDPSGNSPFYDNIHISEPARTRDFDDQRLELLAFLDSEFKIFDPARVVENPLALSEEQSQLLAIHNETLARLEKLNEDLVTQSIANRAELEKSFSAKVSEIEEQFQKKEEELKEDLAKREGILTKKEEDLEIKIKSIDDRDNTHARRQIRDGMLADVAERIQNFGVSEATAAKRVPVRVAIGVLLLVFIGLIVVTLQDLSRWSDAPFYVAKAADISVDLLREKTIEKYWLWTRLTLLTFGLLGTFLYYIRWENRWAEQHIASELQLQQFHIDVNRASWVIESCLEWRKETGSALPKALISSITNGLFVDGRKELEAVVHPADQLASALLGSASNLKLKLGENELEVKPNKIPKKPIPVTAKPQDD